MEDRVRICPSCKTKLPGHDAACVLMHQQRIRAERDHYREGMFAAIRRERSLIDFVERLEVIFAERGQDDHIHKAIRDMLAENKAAREDGDDTAERPEELV